MKKINADRILSISAMLVSMGTLFIIIYQTNLMRTSQKASVMPYVSINLSLGEGEQEIRVENSGLGPALIRSVKVITEQQAFEGDPYYFAKEQLGEQMDSLQKVSTDLLLPGRLIPANSSISAFSHGTKGTYGNYIVETYAFNFIRLGAAVLEVEYESVYGDRWMTRSDESVPVRLD